MEIVIPPPVFLLWMFLGLDAVVVLSVLLKKGKPAARIAALVITGAVTVTLLVLLYRPVRLEVRSDALVDGTYFGTRTVPWSEVVEARAVPGFESTDWKPVRRVNGTALPTFRAGWFVLANGERARVLIQESPDALLLRTADTVYLFAPDRYDELVAAVSRYVPVGGEP